MGTLRVTIEPTNDGDVIRVKGTVPPKETEKEGRAYSMDTSMTPVPQPLVIEIEGGEKLNIECEMLQKHDYDAEQFAAVKIPPDVTIQEYKEIERKRNEKEAKEREDEEEKRTGTKKKHAERLKQLEEDSRAGRTTPVGGSTDEEVRGRAGQMSGEGKVGGEPKSGAQQTPFPGTGAQVGGARDSHDVKGEAHKPEGAKPSAAGSQTTKPESKESKR